MSEPERASPRSAAAWAWRARRLLGALLLDHYEPDGRLIYAGRVGTGMSVEKRLKPLSVPKTPLSVPPPRRSRFGGPLALSKVHWVRPETRGFFDEAKSGPKTLMIASIHLTRDASVGCSSAVFENAEITSSGSKESDKINREMAPRQLDTWGENPRPEELIVFSIASRAQK